MGKFKLSNLMNEHSKAAGSGDALMFTIEHIPIESIIPSGFNKYIVDDVAELKASIELYGLQQNLLVRHKPELGGYELLSGHRRYKALQELNAEGKTGFNRIPCRIVKSADDIQAELQLIFANATSRRLTDYEITYQAGRIKELLTQLQESGDKIEGKKREIVAEFLKVSPSQVGRMESINKNLSPELKEEFKDGKINITTAFEASRLNEAQQAEILEKHKAGETITPGKVKEKREKPPKTGKPPKMPQTLLPCPFCGGEASIKQFANPKSKHCIRCNVCGCGTDGFRYSSEDSEENKQKNIEAWSKRI